ncbi:hypothetical protein [Cellulomonas biazotea]|uniref:Uncharacterized protein n=1 Tax=Cellulomonas biazotea TaxID=1709 RepID=A0A402DNF3_9CELL|nr:hypothetical protein [Cellulomonas biazotea]GCE75636.1 hypothetical protein CBZ_06920 [Cellulomonas biazotea]
MGLLNKALVSGAVLVVGARVRAQVRDARETKRRKSSAPQFDTRLSGQDFIDIAGEIARKTPRVVRAEVRGMTVTLVVRSNSGLTNWEAEADFNDYGRLTGTYWLTSENDQSPIPEFFASGLQDEVCKRIGAPSGP